MNKYLLTLIICISLPIISNDNKVEAVIEKSSEWVLIKRSSKMSPANSEVLYFMLNDAVNTYQARRFNDWDEFSSVDSRNLERLNKGDRVRVLESKFGDKIYKVKLLDGKKNRNFFIITEDLKKNFKLMTLENE